MHMPRLHLDQTVLLLVDMQERLVPHMHERATLVRRAVRLVQSMQTLGLPLLVSEQYRKGLGATIPEIGRYLSHEICLHEKTQFSAFVPPIRHQLDKLAKPNVLLAGIETHACILQTAMDLKDAGYHPFVVVDATSSRRNVDKTTALHRLYQIEAVPTTVEAAVLELLQDASHDRFRAVHRLISGSDDS